MIHRTRSLLAGLLSAALCAAGPSGLARGAAPTLTTLYQFGTNGAMDGYDPASPVVVGAGGVIYGVTLEGGTFGNADFGLGDGIAYTLTPPASPGQPWTEQVIWNFGAPGDGVWPEGIALGSGGVLYGATNNGGVAGKGSVFALTPPDSPGGAWTEQVLWSFGVDSGDGAQPDGGVVVGRGGVLYGTTAAGGASGNGAVFALAPPALPGGVWTESLIWSFLGNPTDGAVPQAGLTAGADGVLYGDTRGGGTHDGGTVFSLTPPASQGGTWTEAILHSFGSYSGLNAPLTLSGGVLYGSTVLPPYSGGVVFSLTPPKKQGSQWAYRGIYSLPRKGHKYRDGELVNGPLVVQDNGSIIGTAVGGGDGGNGDGEGTIFRLKPPAQPGQPWAAKVLYKCGAGNDLTIPAPGLVKSGQGALYGTSAYGGPSARGAVFSFVP